MRRVWASSSPGSDRTVTSPAKRERSSRRAAPPTGSGRAPPDPPLTPTLSRKRERELKRPPLLVNVVALDHVAGAHVLIILEGHAAFLAGHHLAGVILEALELRQPAFVDHDVVADQADMRAALHDPVEDAAARDLADLRDVEDLDNLGFAEALLAQRRGEHARHRRFHIVHEVVDDVVVADLDAGLLGRLARLLVGADV